MSNFNIALIGMMGAGKTMIGNLLAQKLNILFIDSDQMIEQKYYSTISEIFAHFGEEEFRKIESSIIIECINSISQPYVLSLGGGAFLAEKVRFLTRAKCFVIFLNVSTLEIIRRLKNDKTRPLLHNNQRKEDIISALMKIRTPIYSQSDLTINCDDLSVHSIVDTIIQSIKVAGN